jgi:hypothetical protein
VDTFLCPMVATGEHGGDDGETSWLTHPAAGEGAPTGGGIR